MVDTIRLKSKHWLFAAIGAVLTLLCAVIIMLDPFGAAMALWIFTGITLIVEAFLDIVTIILNRAAGTDAVIEEASTTDE